LRVALAAASSAPLTALRMLKKWWPIIKAAGIGAQAQ
jgi:hypothetical protein